MKESNQPIPQGKYLPAVRNNDIIYTSGMTPRKSGELMFVGKILNSKPIKMYEKAIHTATQNALIAAQSCLTSNEKIAIILQLTIYLNTEQTYTNHAKIANFASEFLLKELGENCIGSRAAIGVASLPGDAPVEISLIAKISTL